MPHGYSYALHQLLIPAIGMLFLVGALVSASIGAGLILCSGRLLRLCALMNTYVSTRHGLKALSMPHDVGQSARRHRRLVGAVLIAGAVVSVYGLTAWLDDAALVAAAGLRYSHGFVAWIVASTRWSLIVFNAFAFVIGVMLCYFPGPLRALEARANHWYSARHFTKGADTMHLTLDKLVEAFPRSAGLIIVTAALYVAANAVILRSQF